MEHAAYFEADLRESQEPRLPLYWGVFFDKSDTTEQLLRQLCKDSPPYFKQVAEKHVTLMFAGAAATGEAGAKAAELSLSEFERHRSELERWTGRDVEVALGKYAQDQDVACVTAKLPSGLPC